MTQQLYTTEIRAQSPQDGKIKLYAGPHVPGNSFEDAEKYCEENGLGYCWVTGVLIEEIQFNNLLEIK